ncbi:hypothetical protein ACIRF8_12725 [Streptomyces sp. NPDC102406]|uniref:hypothetical protein n=1 Tax=Streptomyces sp. NPDC102406 TaxID=3366171 RepID=UPI0038273D7A
MPDLHGWLAEQVERAQQRAGRWHDAECAALDTSVADAAVLHAATLCDCGGPAAVLRRCEADRQILTIHAVSDDGYSAACDGCGTAGICDDWVTDNINDCPILLAVAHAHGLTPEILARLDRPEPPQRAQPTAGHALNPDAWARYLLTGQLPERTTMRDVPAALRGPNWKPGR